MVAQKLGMAAIDPLTTLLSTDHASAALESLSRIAATVPGCTEKLVPAVAPLALSSQSLAKPAIAILAGLRERDRWAYEKALRLAVSPEDVKRIQDLADGEEEEEEDEVEITQVAQEIAPVQQPSPDVISSPDVPVSRRTTRGRKSHFFRPPATPTDSDAGTPDFRARISSIAATQRDATPSDSGSPAGLPPFPGSAIRDRGSLPPLPMGTPGAYRRESGAQQSPWGGANVHIDERKFRLSMSFRDDHDMPEEGGEWQGNSLADELDAAGWDGIMDEVGSLRSG